MHPKQALRAFFSRLGLALWVYIVVTGMGGIGGGQVA